MALVIRSVVACVLFILLCPVVAMLGAIAAA